MISLTHADERTLCTCVRKFLKISQSNFTCAENSHLSRTVEAHTIPVLHYSFSQIRANTTDGAHFGFHVFYHFLTDIHGF